MKMTNIGFYFPSTFLDAYQMPIEARWPDQSKRYFNNCCSQAYEQQNRYEDSAIKKIIKGFRMRRYHIIKFSDEKISYGFQMRKYFMFFE